MMILQISILIVILMSLNYFGHAFVPSNRLASSEYWYLDDAYEDLAKENVTKDRPSIHAQTITENHVKLFVPYLPSAHEPTIRTWVLYGSEVTRMDSSRENYQFKI